MNCADVAIKGSSTSFTGKQMTIANHNGYPTIPEFNGDYNTGLEHYKNAAQITVAGSGSSSSGGKGDSQSVYVSSSVGGPIGHGPQTASSTVAVVPSPVYSPSPAPVYSSVAPVPKPSVVATPAPQPTSVASTSCTHGAMQCNGSGYKVCVWGTWSKDINCPARTACKQTSASAVICDWA
ncbi:hypothetical protein LPJ56_004784 [Coemansia sp. RSA 2599]|nr:hypothetical protein LPJ75_004651 [Coemansia sp. RSA 2598]KAJ1814686.1 hypothetical protein LPJ56_004784 [Coemansia sp. RSA 2599]